MSGEQGLCVERDRLFCELMEILGSSNSKCVAEIGTAGGFVRGRKRDE